MWSCLVRRLFSRDRPAAAEPRATLPETILYRSPADLPAIALGDLWATAVPSIAYSEAPEPRMLLRPAPLGIDDPDGVNLPVPPDLLAQLLPPPFAVAAPRVRLIGARTYLTQDDSFFTDEIHLAHDRDNYLGHIVTPDDVLNESTGLAPGPAPERPRIAVRERPVTQLPGPVISLATAEWGGYGSFLFRLMPKLAIVAARPSDWTILTPPLLPQMRDLLKLAGVDEKRIVEQKPGRIYEMERAVIPSMRGTHALMDAASRQLFSGLRDRFASDRAARRLYVSRRGWQPYGVVVRPLLNEDEVEEGVRSLGFEIIRPHAMTMAEQIATFADAAIVVGPAGSAMYNTVFCRPGTIVVDIESEPHWLMMHLNIFGSCELPYVVFQAKAADQDWTVPHKPLTVNVPALLARLRSL